MKVPTCMRIKSKVSVSSQNWATSFNKIRPFWWITHTFYTVKADKNSHLFSTDTGFCIQFSWTQTVSKVIKNLLSLSSCHNIFSKLSNILSDLGFLVLCIVVSLGLIIWKHSVKLYLLYQFQQETMIKTLTADTQSTGQCNK